MILATHALIGAAIGKNIDNPWLVIVLAFASHFLLDSFRHGEYIDIAKEKGKKIWIRIGLDIAFGMSIVFLYLSLSGFDSKIVFNTLLGSFFSALPDLFTLLYLKFRLQLFKIFVDFGEKVHPYPMGAPETLWNFRNAANDILFSLIAIIALFY